MFLLQKEIISLRLPCTTRYYYCHLYDAIMIIASVEPMHVQMPSIHIKNNYNSSDHTHILTYCNAYYNNKIVDLV